MDPLSFMHLRISLIHIIFILLFTYSNPATAKGFADTIYWSAGKKLTWADFKAKPVKGKHIQAISSVAILFNLSEDDEPVVTPVFYPGESWVDFYSSGFDTIKTLQHEQLHFDITELYARIIRKELKEKIHSLEDQYLLIEEIFTRHIKKFVDEQHQYDEETYDEEEKQKLWDLKIKKRLEALNDFSTK